MSGSALTMKSPTSFTLMPKMAIVASAKTAIDQQHEQHAVLVAPVPHAPARDDVLVQQLAAGAVEAGPRDELVGQDVDAAAEGDDEEERRQQRPAQRPVLPGVERGEGGGARQHRDERRGAAELAPFASERAALLVACAAAQDRPVRGHRTQGTGDWTAVHPAGPRAGGDFPRSTWHRRTAARCTVVGRMPPRRTHAVFALPRRGARRRVAGGHRRRRRRRSRGWAAAPCPSPGSAAGRSACRWTTPRRPGRASGCACGSPRAAARRPARAS